MGANRRPFFSLSVLQTVKIFSVELKAPWQIFKIKLGDKRLDGYQRCVLHVLLIHDDDDRRLYSPKYVFTRDTNWTLVQVGLRLDLPAWNFD